MIEKREMEKKKEKDVRAEQRAYEKRKEWVRKYEHENYSTIVLFKSIASKKANSGNWWKMGGHSLEIYLGKLAPRLKLHPRVVTDTDFHNKFREGIISVRDIDNFEKKMESLKIYRNLKLSTPGIKIFSLGYKISEEDLQIMRKADEERKKRLNEVVYVQMIAPEINTGLLEYLRTLKHKYDKMPVTDRDFLGEVMLKHARAAMIAYMMTAKGAMNMGKGLQTIVREVDMLMCYNSLAGEYGVIDLGACTRMLDELVKVRRIANARLTGGSGLEEQMAGIEMREKMGLNKKMK